MATAFPGITFPLEDWISFHLMPAPLHLCLHGLLDLLLYLFSHYDANRFPPRCGKFDIITGREAPDDDFSLCIFLVSLELVLVCIC